MGELPETQTADTEFAEKGSRAPAQFAPIVLAALELGFALILDALGCCAHPALFPRTGRALRVLWRRIYAATRNGIPKAFSSERAWLSSGAVVTIVMFMPFSFSTLE